MRRFEFYKAISANIKSVVTVALMTCSVSVSAQTEKPEISTDRPDFSSTPMIIPKGSIQIETGFFFEQDKSGGLNQTNIAFNSTLVKLGVNEHFEVGVNFGYLGSQLKDEDTERIRGFGPLAFGIKIKLADEKGFWPQAAIVSHINVRTGSKDFNPDYTSNDISFAFSHSITEVFAITYNAGVGWNGMDPQATFLYTFTSDVVLTKRLSCFAETYGFIPESGELSSRMDAGFLFKITPVFQFDISAGAGLSRNAPQYFISSGLSVRLLK